MEKFTVKLNGVNGTNNPVELSVPTELLENVDNSVEKLTFKLTQLTDTLVEQATTALDKAKESGDTESIKQVLSLLETGLEDFISLGL